MSPGYVGHEVGTPAVKAPEGMVPVVGLKPWHHDGTEPRRDVLARQILDGDIAVVGTVKGGNLGLPNLLEGSPLRARGVAKHQAGLSIAGKRALAETRGARRKISPTRPSIPAARPTLRERCL